MRDYSSLPDPTTDQQPATKKYVDDNAGGGGGGGVTDHGDLTGLADDDHTQYALLAGRGSNQTLKGATTDGGSITITSTSHDTKGRINLGASGNVYVDETTDTLTQSPSWTDPAQAYDGFVIDVQALDYDDDSRILDIRIGGETVLRIHPNGTILFGPSDNSHFGFKATTDAFSFVDGLGNVATLTLKGLNFDGATGLADSTGYMLVSRDTTYGTTISNGAPLRLGRASQGVSVADVGLKNVRQNIAQVHKGGASNLAGGGFEFGHTATPGTTSAGCVTEYAQEDGDGRLQVWHQYEDGEAQLISSRPTVVESIVIDSTGDTTTINYNLPVTGHAGFTITPDGGAATLTYTSGDGTAAHVYDNSRTIAADEVVTADYTPGDVNLLAAFADFPVTNNSSAGGTFDPLTLNPVYYFDDANTTSYQTNGGSPATAGDDPVGQWQDQSGNGHHLNQATAGKRPLLKLSQVNGHAALLFDGTDDYLQTVFTFALPYHLFIVYKSVTIGSSGGHDIIFDGGSTYSLIASDTTPKTQWYGGNTENYNANICNGVFGLIEVKASGSAIVMKEDGVTRINGSGVVYDPGGFTLAALNDGSRTTNIMVACAIAFSGEITGQDYTDLTTFLQDKFGTP